MSEHQETPTKTEALMGALVQSLFGVFGAPDDLAVGQQADDLLAALHHQLAASRG
jgi:hypothetical protein